jgi:hypothetical protein
MEKFR